MRSATADVGQRDSAYHSLMPLIVADNLAKTFRVPVRETGLGAALKSLLSRKHRTVEAVRGVSLRIDEGEVVGFLGPNGAGKTTTLKMLTGLLHPSAGSADVLGHTPWRREARFLRQISLLMGQRSQMNWDLPVADSFAVHLALYGIDPQTGKQTLDELVSLLELGALLQKQARALSLGERMKCEICMALLHRPRVLFLDEPTIGVDVTMQARIRSFIGEYNRKYQATVILTSHYMADVTALCRRLIVIDQGTLLFDGPLSGLVQRLAPFKFIAVDLERDVTPADAGDCGEVVARDGRKLTFRVPKERAPEATAALLARLPVLDLTIQDPPIEDVIARAFAGAAAAPSSPGAAQTGAPSAASPPTDATEPAS